MELGRQQRVPEQKCVHCCHIANGAAQVGGDDNVSPREGDACLCINCGEWNVVGDDLKYRKPSIDEHIELGRNKEAQQARAVWVRTFGHLPQRQTR